MIHHNFVTAALFQSVTVIIASVVRMTGRSFAGYVRDGSGNDAGASLCPQHGDALFRAEVGAGHVHARGVARKVNPRDGEQVHEEGAVRPDHEGGPARGVQVSGKKR